MPLSRTARPSLAALVPMLALLFVWGNPAPAQDAGDYRRWLDQRAQRLLDAARQQKDGSQLGAEHARRVREELEAQKRAIEREKTYSFAEPVLTPDGRKIAAMVNDSYMTLEELNSRVAAVLKDMEPIRHPDPKERLRLREDRFLSIANQLISDWVMTTMLALQGKGLGFSASEQEVEEALEELNQAQLERVDSEGAASPTQMIGIPESQLREEVRNSLIIEKYINNLVDIQFDEADYRRIYRIDPNSFTVPDRVRAFHVFHPLPVRRDADTMEEVEDVMKDIQKKLRRTDAEEMAEIVRESEDEPWTAGDMGWVNSTNRTVPPVLLRALFSTEVEKASPVFQSREGFHVVRIMEREKSRQKGFEAAKPQIRNYLFTKTKYATYESTKSLYDIRYNTGGLKHWKEVSAEEAIRLGKERAERPEMEQGITITELRKEIAREKGEEGGSQESASSSPSSRRPEAAEAPAIDLSILQ